MTETKTTRKLTKKEEREGRKILYSADTYIRRRYDLGEIDRNILRNSQRIIDRAIFTSLVERCK